MMADLDPLIKLRKHGIDEKRKIVADLFRQVEKLEQEKKSIQDQIEKETKLAKEMATLDASAYLGRYLEGARKKIRTIEQSVRKLETRIIVAQEDMRNAFAEMKKIEITQSNREKKEKKAKDKKESQDLDEIAIETYRRKLDED